MTYEYSPRQIKLARKLVPWATKTMPEGMARLEIAAIIKSNTHDSIQSAMRHSGCRTVKDMKAILKARKQRHA